MSVLGRRGEGGGGKLDITSLTCLISLYVRRYVSMCGVTSVRAALCMYVRRYVGTARP